jgi:hypothetical protein
MTQQYGPLILVFYIFRDVLSNPEIREQYSKSVEEYFNHKGDDVRIFFIPTDTEERLECVNPKFIDDKNTYEQLVKDLEEVKLKFDVGVDNGFNDITDLDIIGDED